MLEAADGVTNTYPPLNAPTGFRTGNGETSANLRGEVWKLRVAFNVAAGVDKRMAGLRMRVAIAV